jgi:two-component system NarL family sensor kinase
MSSSVAALGRRVEAVGSRGLRGWPLAWSAVALMLLVLSAAVDAVRLTGPAEAGAGLGSLACALGLVVTVSGALICSRYPKHLVGLVLVGFGLLWALDGLMESWSLLGAARGGALPGTSFAYWFFNRVGAFLLVGLPLLLVLYPTGRLLPGRWRAVSVLAVAMSCALPLALLVMPLRVVQLGGAEPPPVPELELLSLPVSDEVGYAILVVSQLVTFCALVPTLLVLYLRLRSAARGRRGPVPTTEEEQLRWLLWAALLCAIVVVLGLLFPFTPVATVALYLAVAASALSVTIGIVQPDLLDINALVAGTLVYSGVAGCVIALDLVVLAAADQLLGDRLDQRAVTYAVLIIAVAGYGPLRQWLSRLVRRWLVGRRSDRYQVVSGLAARLEVSAGMDDLLPALASSVAETFKLSFVAVEVRNGSETVTATFGRRPDDVQELPIGYQGEPLGRLILPARGLRALLSKRDQALLVDVVRQAAIAVRTSRLAAELQRSRERLIESREDDRRRIRRDLHDGLGPVLGGVAMRLDAARNAVDVDPERSKVLIRQSRDDLAEALADVRRLVHGLRPPALDDLGLLAAIEQQAERARATPMTVEVDADSLDGLTAAVEVAAFRVVSEALTNVTRHSGASCCRITLTRSPEALELVVADNGRGIGAETVAGVGLLSMRERAEELGGRCQVSCPPDGGTEVRVSLPLAVEAPLPEGVA